MEALSKFLQSKAKTKIVKFLYEHSDSDYSKTDISRGVKLSRPTVWTYIKQLEGEGLVVLSRKVGNTTLYRINLKSPVVKQLKKLEILGDHA